MSNLVFLRLKEKKKQEKFLSNRKKKQEKIASGRKWQSRERDLAQGDWAECLTSLLDQASGRLVVLDHTHTGRSQSHAWKKNKRVGDPAREGSSFCFFLIDEKKRTFFCFIPTQTKDFLLQRKHSKAKLTTFKLNPSEKKSISMCVHTSNMTSRHGLYPTAIN